MMDAEIITNDLISGFLVKNYGKNPSMHKNITRNEIKKKTTKSIKNNILIFIIILSLFFPPPPQR